MVSGTGGGETTEATTLTLRLPHVSEEAADGITLIFVPSGRVCGLMRLTGDGCRWWAWRSRGWG